MDRNRLINSNNETNLDIANGRRSYISNSEIYKDSLENSLNMVNCISITDSLNNINLKTPIKDARTEEWSTDEKTNFSNKLKDLKKSIVKNGLGSNAVNLTQTNAFSNTYDIEETSKISYKFISKQQEEEQKRLNKALERETQNIKNPKTFWFAAYDKLLNSKKLLKILSYYGTVPESMKEKAIVVKDFDIYFTPLPVIAVQKGGFVFVKLYCLTIDQINKVYKYINKTESVLTEDDFTSNNNVGEYSKIKAETTHMYPYLICLGSFLNTNIYTFTQMFERNSICSDALENSFKSKIKTIAKMIKYLIKTFPNYSTDFFIYHMYSKSGVSNFNYFTMNLKNFNTKSSKEEQNTTKVSYYSHTNVSNNFNINKIDINPKGVNNNKKFLNHSLGYQSKQMNNSTSNTSGTNINAKNYNSVSNNSKQNIKLNAKRLCFDPPTTRFQMTSSNKDSPKGNVYVVTRKLRTELDSGTDEDDSVNPNGQERIDDKKIYLTPKKKKTIKYYS